MKGICAGASVLALAACTGNPAQQAVLEAWEREEPLPVLSAGEVPGLTTEQAYGIQWGAVNQRLQGQRPDGYKAGLTSAAGQQKFGVKEPVAGVLWPSSVIDASQEPGQLKMREFRRPMLELELAFRVNRHITEPVASTRQLQEMISEVLPVVEIPDLGFDQPQRLTGPDIVAANVAASYTVVGKAFPADTIDINAVFARLEHNGETLQRAQATAVMGSQWRALLWLVNQRIASGWLIEPGQLLLTGAMGPMLPMKPGLYVAYFGDLGQFSFNVQ